MNTNKLSDLTVEKVIKYKNDIIDIFVFAKTIDDFVKKTEELSIKYIDNEDTLNSFKGDTFEIFSELFFMTFHADPEVGLTNYEPIPLNEDYGVDAIATNVVGNNVVVQCKYKSNPMELIDYASICRTYSAGIEKHTVELNKSINNTIFIITTGAGVTEPCHNVFKNKLRVINKQILSSKIDNNQIFWKNCAEILISSIEN